MPCFVDSSDFLVYLALLRQLVVKLRCDVHAYCLMTNHIHLLLTAPERASLGRLMHGLGQRYASYFNRRYSRTGTLWEGRFKSCVVDSSRYVLACYRYIEMNPVRAGMVSHPREYAWSSFNGNSGAQTDPLLTPHSECIALGDSGYSELYADALPEGLVLEIREAINSGIPLASDQLKLQVASGGGYARKGKPGRPKRAAASKSVTVPDFGVSGDGAS